MRFSASRAASVRLMIFWRLMCVVVYEMDPGPLDKTRRRGGKKEKKEKK